VPDAHLVTAFRLRSTPLLETIWKIARGNYCAHYSVLRSGRSRLLRSLLAALKIPIRAHSDFPDSPSGSHSSTHFFESPLPERCPASALHRSSLLSSRLRTVLGSPATGRYHPPALEIVNYVPQVAGISGFLRLGDLENHPLVVQPRLVHGFDRRTQAEPRVRRRWT
jgi:hypothetical protein